MILHPLSPLAVQRAACILLFSLCMCACATNGAPPSPGCTQQIITRMYFGLQSPQGQVSEPQWKSFLATQITPRFPAGFTVFAGNGQWRNAQGEIISEDSRIVEIVYPNEADAAIKIQAITRLYKSSFLQESVLALQHPVIACF
jgi:Protein of unknown function (DUF3574)